MVRNYVRKSSRGQGFSKEALHTALREIEQGKSSLKQASKVYKIPLGTLSRHKNKKVSSPGKIKFGSYKTCLPAEVETELVFHVRDLSVKFHGITSIDLRKLAYEIASKYAINNVFNQETKMAGRDWLRGFIKRHNLTIRQNGKVKVIGQGKSSPVLCGQPISV